MVKPSRLHVRREAGLLPKQSLRQSRSRQGTKTILSAKRQKGLTTSYQYIQLDPFVSKVCTNVYAEGLGVSDGGLGGHGQ